MARENYTVAVTCSQCGKIEQAAYSEDKYPSRYSGLDSRLESLPEGWLDEKTCGACRKG